MEQLMQFGKVLEEVLEFHWSSVLWPDRLMSKDTLTPNSET